MAARPTSVFDAARVMLQRMPAGAAGKLIENFLLPDQLDRTWMKAVEDSPGPSVFANFLAAMGVRWDCADDDIARLPATGPAVIVANHPFGLVEGQILCALAARVRSDFKILVNSVLADVPALRDYAIAVDVSGAAARENSRSLRHAIAWVRRGGMLITFPAGEVSSLQLSKLYIADPAWSGNVTRIIQMTQATSVPVFFHGANGPGFQMAGLIHPSLRTALLPRELLNKRGRVIRVSIGHPIAPARVAKLAATDYLWHRTHILQARNMATSWRFQLPQAAIAGPVKPGARRAEVESLGADRLLLESGDYAVYCANASHIPNTLREIGRLREIAFRKAGEGTGRSLDLDRFDTHYHHLWMWNRKSQEVVGAYRMCGTDSVRARRDLYSSTLFRFRAGLLEKFHPALELGRSFVRPEYQKSAVALLLLWKGIGQFVARHPRYRVLFGPVSISREYNPVSRDLMVSFLEARCNQDLAALVEPRRKLHTRRLRACDTRLLGSLLSDVDELSEVVADLEADGKGVPVLVRQYLKVGGEMLAFNVDADFSDVVDGLVMVDLARLSRPLLDRYLGKPGADQFLAFHATRSVAFSSTSRFHSTSSAQSSPNL
jgi:putative hemolysin